MKEYVVNNKKFLNICSIHDEINNISYRLQKKDIPEEIIEQLELINELTNVAKEMGQHMEDALRNKSYNNSLESHYYNTFMINPSMEDD